ncbi:MAG: phosphoribosylformylglycinamidine synthase subunit PurS [Acidobacteria bacterium]|nr:phosphoribosylformylglycinamidine synthase subunit PurS [Thermoanaerobaculia bacterium]MBP7813218.1 phosphoribosylformylglycinamidine synthase subunit PurS [Thermoanaerobaculia bacterium]NLN12231.1 phosphoribosylformylglycinamidine synthase subunit PurS [Acidobacteriota bacterium]OQC42437.1 MAG: phosphoribosylformylglycinamidine synthase subunit PurS [Acidobacteria bacterium ADurb.Bin051]
MKATVTIYPRREILDAEGKAIREALAGLGFSEVREVRAGRRFELDLGDLTAARAGKRVREMCERLLANPMVEEYEIEVEGRPRS